MGTRSVFSSNSPTVTVEPRRRLVLATLLCAVTLLLFAASGDAHADGKLWDATADVPRPADVYVIISEADHSICGAILSSLNKEYRVRANEAGGHPAVSMDSDSLLGSDLQVPWMRKLVQQSDAVTYKTTTFDFAQVKLKGRAITLFRRGLEKFSVETGALSMDRLWMSETAPPSLASDHPMRANDVDRLNKGTEIAIDITDVGDVSRRRNLAVSKNHHGSVEPVLLNVVSVKERLYLLVADAFEAEIAAPKSTTMMFDIIVLELISPNEIRAVCRLRSS